MHKKVSSAKELIRIFQICSNIKVVSFDVFDTLIHRYVYPPELTKVPAAKKLCSILERYSIHIALQDAINVRATIETALRKQSLSNGYDPECSITDVFKDCLRHYLNNSDLLNLSNEILQAEILGEISVCYPVGGMADAVKESRRIAPRVVYLSDMYLGKEHIDMLLKSCGYHDLFMQGYVSSEYKLNKGSGRLYKRMLETEGVKPEEWLHIGDNFKSDIQNVKKTGGKAVYLKSVDHLKRVSRFKRLNNLSRINPQWSGAQWLEMSCVEKSNRKVHNSFFDLGFFLLGPILFNYLQCAVYKLIDNQIEFILFPAREGFVLRKLYRIISSAMGVDEIPSAYAFLTRKAVYLASVDRIGVREIKTGLWTQNPTLGNMLLKFNLNPEDFYDLAIECGIDSFDTEVSVPFQDQAFLQFLRDDRVLDLIRKKQRESKQLVYKYLDGLGFWEYDKVAYIDVGWNGTVQDALTCAFANHSKWPEFYGIYLGFNRAKPIIETPRSHYIPLFYDRKKSPIGTDAIRHFVELFEICTRAHHATTIGFTVDASSGDVVPVLKNQNDPNRKREILDQMRLSDIQRGIFDFANMMRRLVPFQKEHPEKYTQFYLGQIDRFIRLPTTNESLLLSHFFHSEDFGLDIEKKLTEPENLLSLQGIKKFLSEFKMNTWREGAAAATGFPLAAYFYVLWRLAVRGIF